MAMSFLSWKNVVSHNNLIILIKSLSTTQMLKNTLHKPNIHPTTSCIAYKDGKLYINQAREAAFLEDHPIMSNNTWDFVIPIWSI